MTSITYWNTDISRCIVWTFKSLTLPIPSNPLYTTLHYMVKKIQNAYVNILFFSNFSELVQGIPIYLVLDRTQINELWSQSNPPKILKYIRGKQTCQTSFWSIILWWISLTFKGLRRHLPYTIESTTLQISMQILVLFPLNIFILKEVYTRHNLWIM